MYRRIAASMLALALSAFAAPSTLPAFSLPDLAGKAHPSSEYAGKPVLIDFWATWCATCKESVPEIANLKAKYAAKGLQVVSISVDKGAAAKVEKGARKLGITWQILHDPQSSLSSTFGFTGVPALYLFDAQGKLVSSLAGFDPTQEAALDAALSKL
ncbi:MAG TPA: TlpA disulfide reductase family protein [Fibrobacteria bacterium]|nr:TlpA disulfide reductase family protein [Fibrobacteria bacterium]HOX53077.1 TlpA disulfide reductase family protein [Fibrobacteria bacterium]